MALALVEPRHERVAAGEQLAGLAGGQRSAGFRVDDTHERAGRRFAVGADPVLGHTFRCGQGHVGTGGFGHAVDARHARPCALGLGGRDQCLEAIADEARRRRRPVHHPGVVGDDLHQRQSAVVGGRLFDDGCERGGAAGDEVGALRLHEAQVARRLGAVGDHQAEAAVHGVEERGRQARDPEERSRRQHTLAGLRQRVHRRHLVRVAHAVAVGVHHALGLRGAAGGVDHEGVIRRGDGRFHGAYQALADGSVAVEQRAGAPGPWGHGVGPDIDTAQMRRFLQEKPLAALAGQGWQGLLEPRQVVVVQVGRSNDQRVDVRVVQYPPEFPCLVQGAHGNHHRTDARRGHECHGELRAVGQQHAHMAAFADAGRYQGSRRGEGPSLQLCERQAVGAAHQQLLISIVAGRMPEHVRDRGGVWR